MVKSYLFRGDCGTFSDDKLQCGLNRMEEIFDQDIFELIYVIDGWGGNKD